MPPFPTLLNRKWPRSGNCDVDMSDIYASKSRPNKSLKYKKLKLLFINCCSSGFFMFILYTCNVISHDIETDTVPRETVKKTWRKLVVIYSYIIRESDKILNKFIKKTKGFCFSIKHSWK